MSEWWTAEKKGRERISEVCIKALGTREGDGAHFGLDASPLHWSLGGAVHPGPLAAIRTVSRKGTTGEECLSVLPTNRLFASQVLLTQKMPEL